MIGPATGIGARLHRVFLENPGPAMPDDDGGYTQTWTPLDPPAMFARISPASAADLERVAQGTSIASATHLVTLPYHSQVTTQTRLLFEGRVFYVRGRTDPDERHIEITLVCQEIVL